MPDILYKNLLIDIPKTTYENEKEYNIRKWFILKNITDKITDEDLTTLINLSKVYIQISIYECEYDDRLMKKITDLTKHLYL